MWQVPTSCEHQRKVPLTSHVQRWEPLIKVRINFIFQVFLPGKTLKFVEWWGWKGPLRSPAPPLCLMNGETEVHPNCSDCFFTFPAPIPPPMRVYWMNKWIQIRGIWVLFHLVIYSTNTEYFLDTVLGTGDTEVDKPEKKSLPSWSLHCRERRWTLKLYAYIHVKWS